MNNVDVLIVGGGPAGAAAAVSFSSARRVAMIDLRTECAPRIGESLPPVARRLFADMGLLDSFLKQNHAPSFGNRSRWGSNNIVENDFLRDPEGHGWHLDRARFDAWLRDAAVERGAELIAPARLISIEWMRDRWNVETATAAGKRIISASVVIDASGRSSTVAHLLGARRRVEDRLFCSWIYGRENVSTPGAGFFYVEAEEDGWWYTAPLPGSRRVLAFHTDADLMKDGGVRSISDAKGLFIRAMRLRGLGQLLGECNFIASDDFGLTAAHSAVLEPFGGPAWLAVGDAAMSFDPLSGQGLLNALFTGLTGANAVEQYLKGEASAFAEYKKPLTGIWNLYRQRLDDCYYAENRWPHSPFWKRRRGHILAGLARARQVTTASL